MAVLQAYTELTTDAVSGGHYGGVAVVGEFVWLLSLDGDRCVVLNGLRIEVQSLGSELCCEHLPPTGEER